MNTPSADDRRAAQDVLRVHLDAGRLDPAEYEDRQVAADRAQSWDVIEALFRDLPSPRLSRPVGDTAVGRDGQQRTPDQWAQQSTVSEPAALTSAPPVIYQTYPISPSPQPQAAPRSSGYRRLLLAAPLIVVLLVFFTGQWRLFLLLPLVYIFARRR